MSNGSYKLMEQNQTWHQAQASCRSLNRELASVRNHTENYRVRRLIPGQQQAWLGLNRHSWKWSDGSNASFSLWQMGSPDNNSGNDSCVVANLNNSAQWEDHNCDSQHPFICYNGKWMSIFGEWRLIFLPSWHGYAIRWHCEDIIDPHWRNYSSITEAPKKRTSWGWDNKIIRHR